MYWNKYISKAANKHALDIYSN